MIKSRVLLISHSSNMTGGGEEDFQRLLSLFQVKGEFNIYVAAPKGPQIEKFKSFATEVFQVEQNIPPFYKFRFKEFLKYLMKIFIQRSEIREIIKKVSPDIIIWNTSIFALLSIFFYKSRNVFFVRENINIKFFKKLTQNIISRNSVCIICVSEFIEKEYKGFKQKPDLVVAYSSFSISTKENNSTASVELDSRYFNILNIGNISPLKGQMQLLYAMKILLENNLNVRLYIVGDYYYPDYFKKMQILINNYNLQSNVIFTGPLKNSTVQEYIKKSFAVVISSFIEGFPLVIPETFYHSKPLITSRYYGFDKVINESNSLIYDTGDYAKLADHILTLIQDKIHYKKIAENGYQTYEKYLKLEDNLNIIYSSLRKQILEYNE